MRVFVIMTNDYPAAVVAAESEGDLAVQMEIAEQYDRQRARYIESNGPRYVDNVFTFYYVRAYQFEVKS